jgi:hypothetical protein
MSKEFNVQTVLELACAAQRVNGRYVKEIETLFASDNVKVGLIHCNKTLMLASLGEASWNGPDAPQRLEITEEDKNLVADIRSYYKRLAFSVMAEPDNSFLSEIMSLLYSENMPLNKFGFIACLPSVYARDKSNTDLKKQARQCDDGHLGVEGDSLFDKDAEIIQVSRSKNFDAWNVLAIIDNKLASWFSKPQLKLGPCVVVRAKVKAQSKHWKFEFDETRLNYVKAVQ